MLKSISDYRERLVTVVSHFLGGSAPDLVTGVVSRCDTYRGAGCGGEWARRSYDEKSEGAISLAESRPL
jgi:hypothetical protein